MNGGSIEGRYRSDRSVDLRRDVTAEVLDEPTQFRDKHVKVVFIVADLVDYH